MITLEHTKKIIESMKTWLMLHGRYAPEEDRAFPESYKAVGACLKELEKIVGEE